MPKSESAARDYRATLFLPQTDFPMKAGLPEAEPRWLARWAEIDLYGRMRTAAKGRPLFLLHDGPPYANGEIHLGTGINKILKDFVVRSQGMLGKDAPYVPGWDCHGLPIEWKIEERYRAEGKSKEQVPVEQLRRDCRAFAEKWIEVQREQFKRLGCIGLWDHPYTTMDYRAEAAIARELFKFVGNGLLYRGFRPVMWSPIEKTALAEAEVEYKEKTSPTIYVKFPINGVEAHGNEELAVWQLASIVIWTTTPWTIPGNRAIAYSPEIEYGLYSVDEIAEDSLAKTGELLVLADTLAPNIFQDAKITKWSRVRNAKPQQFNFCDHPLHGRGFEFKVPVLPGQHVTADTGTGFVHTAPGHGDEDYHLWIANRETNYIIRSAPEIPKTVDEEGKFYDEVPLFGGKYILSRDGKKDGDANRAVIEALTEAGALLAKGTLRHQYPHSWRSKAPVIFRATPQWFAAMDKPFKGSEGKSLRELALTAIEDTDWYPPAGENRMRSMVETRPDWVLSRQRAWGVPLAIFAHKESGEILNDPAVNARICEAFEKEGADAWFSSPPERFLGNDYKADEYEQVKDILDVWFDSGSTHVFTVEEPIDPNWPKADHADVYLEGSDQHRGWFQSSLLESCGTRGRAPYDAVITHGFVLDESGDKMSKSLGNTMLPQAIAEKNGAEILRLVTASADYTGDLRVWDDVIKSNVESYRRLRNTIRFMLANLSGFNEKERVAHSEMPELERYMLARLASLDDVVRDGYGQYDFNGVFTALFAFCTNDLSAFYFDIRKDSLYCDRAGSIRRRSARTTIDEIFRRVVTWFAPILCFTMEEAWQQRFANDPSKIFEQIAGDDRLASVHLNVFPETPRSWHDDALIKKWGRIRDLRRVVTGALEVKRKDKVIGASLEARPVLFVTPEDAALLDGIDLGEIAITSHAIVSSHAAPHDAFRLPDVAGAAAVFHHAEGDKCARCWMILPEVGQNRSYPDLCNRCSDAVTALAGAAA